MTGLLTMLLEADREAFLWINRDLGNSFLDTVLPWCRERWFWMPAYLFIFAFAWINLGTKKGWLLALGLGLTVGLTDFTSSELIKKNVHRIRPCNDIILHDQVHLRIASCGGGYSFTSSHAANHFAAAIFLIGIFGRWNRWVKPILLFWAALIAFSQVYVGVHYPLDVCCGGLLGAGIGWGGSRLLQRWQWFG
jgi:membrane-associated phospholipid phosphatase